MSNVESHRISSENNNKKTMQDINLENPTVEDMTIYMQLLLAEPPVSPVENATSAAFRHMTTARGWK